jgi:hypothetical protein
MEAEFPSLPEPLPVENSSDSEAEESVIENSERKISLEKTFNATKIEIDEGPVEEVKEPAAEKVNQIVDWDEMAKYDDPPDYYSPALIPGFT